MDNVSAVCSVDTQRPRIAPRPQQSTSPWLFDELEIGEVLDDRFEIMDLINRSDMVCIYKAFDRLINETVALKVPLLQFVCDANLYSHFQWEEIMGLTLDHPGVLKILPAGPRKRRPYLVMEHLEGETLEAYLYEECPLPEAKAGQISSQICEALDYLHRKGVVHADLKPKNVMLCNDGTIRIMDFGAARSGGAAGDIYALGAMLYEMVTGALPCDGNNAHPVINTRFTGSLETPRKRNPQLSVQIEKTILRALDPNPSRRFPSAAAMLTEPRTIRAPFMAWSKYEC